MDTNMDKKLKEKMIELVAHYETLFEEAFWVLTNEMPPEEFEKIGTYVCGDKIRSQLKEWFVTPNEIVEGQTPLDFVGALSEADTTEFIYYIYENSSDVIEFYAEALKPKQEFLYESLLKSVKDIGEQDEFNDGLFFELSALFSNYKNLQALDLFIRLVKFAPPQHEDLVDFMQGLIVDYGEVATEKLLLAVKDDQIFEGRVENYYSAISSSGAKCEESFDALVRLFENAPRKSFGAICLAVYADKRAVPMLLEWLEKSGTDFNIETQDHAGTDIVTDAEERADTDTDTDTDTDMDYEQMDGDDENKFGMTEVADVLSALKILGVNVSQSKN